LDAIRGPSVLELRVALTVEDSSRAEEFYRDGLGVEPEAVWTKDDGHGVMFALGQASLELFDPAYAAYVDEVEVGAAVSGPVRLALRVPDVAAALERALRHGGVPVHEPVQMPWGGLNARVQAPDGMQITLFQATAE